MNTTALVDGILVLLCLELCGLLLWRRVRHSGMPTRELVSFLGAGGGLLLALRALVRGAPFIWFAAAMLLALLMHLWHVRQRWQPDHRTSR